MKKIAIFTMVIVCLAACKKDSIEKHSNTTQDGLTSNKDENSNTPRPISLTLTSSADPASPALTCSLPGVPFGIANSGYFLHGYASHLGMINPELSMGIDGSCNLSGSSFILSTATSGQIVAANGDKITYTGADAIDLNNIIFHGGTTGAITGIWTITGGTGRFADATGSFSITGLVNVASVGGPTFSVTGDGTINY